MWMLNTSILLSLIKFTLRNLWNLSKLSLFYIKSNLSTLQSKSVSLTVLFFYDKNNPNNWCDKFYTMMDILAYLNPFKIFRDFVQYPIETFVSDQYTGYKKKTNESITSVKELLYRAGLVAVLLSAILWISIFLYVIFYYTYMPNVTHVRPVHLQFK